MQIRKNTKAFKAILEIVTACRDRPDREQLIRVYITKAGDSIRERISIEGIEREAGAFYDLGYQAVLGNLNSSNHQLHQSDEIPGIYFFHSSSNKVWDETPFEFDEAIKKDFGSLPDLPVLRKKEKAEKFVLPAPRAKKESSPVTKEKAETKKEKPAPKKSAKVIDIAPKQPDYNLKHQIHFTGLERITFREPQLTKRDVLDYYNEIAEHILPYLIDRPQVIRLRDRQQVAKDLDGLRQSTKEEIPAWIQTAALGKAKGRQQLLLCNDKEHLLFYVQLGCIEFNACHSRIKSLDFPDYAIIVIESPDYELSKAIAVALVAKEIFKGLQLPSFLKTEGASRLHIYIPLDSKSGFESSKHFAEYLCKLIRLKMHNSVTLKGLEKNDYGKVTLDYALNEPDAAVVAPYSLVAGESSIVASPLSWEALKPEAELAEANHESIFKRLKEKGDPFEMLLKKRINADALLEKMEQNYSFLF